VTISSHFVHFSDFALLFLMFSKNFGKILDSFELQKFWTHNAKAKAKDKKVNIAAT
jgi:hypothetical protein